MLLGVFAVGLTFQLVNSGSPDVAVSCDAPAFALAKEETRLTKAVQWTVTGPDDGVYFLALNVESFERAADGTFRSVPASGRTRDQTQQLSDDVDVGGDCRGTGVFGVLAPVQVGDHTVGLFRRTPTTIERVASKKLTVIPGD
ncbi:MAG TPA: hypothetical protein VNB94_01480 [Mycobacteriales bacterium]|nr:hypothetical protein [Mycobacteriales bacterium]